MSKKIFALNKHDKKCVTEMLDDSDAKCIFDNICADGKVILEDQ